MVQRVRGTVRYMDDEERVKSEENPKLSDLPKEVQEQESIQELVYDDKEADGPEPANTRTVQSGAGASVGAEERREGAAKASDPEESAQPKESKDESKSKDS